MALARMRHFTPHLPLLELWAAELVQRHLEVAAAATAAAGSAAGSLEGSTAGAEEEAGGSQARNAGPGSSGPPPSLARMTSLLWALATLGHQPTLLLDLLPAVMRMHSEWEDASAAAVPPRRLRRACTVGWSMAAAGCLSHPAVLAVAAELAAAAALLQPDDEPQRAELLQVHQFVTALELEAAAAPSSSEAADCDPMPGPAPPASPPAQALGLLAAQPAAEQLRRQAAAAWEEEGRRRDNKSVSACQADVAATARAALGLSVKEEFSLAGISSGWAWGMCKVTKIGAVDALRGDGLGWVVDGLWQPAQGRSTALCLLSWRWSPASLPPCRRPPRRPPCSRHCRPHPQAGH